MAGESIEDLAGEVASLQTRADSWESLVKKLHKLLPSRSQDGTRQRSRDSNSSTGGQTGHQFDVQGVLRIANELITQIRPLQQDIRSLASRIKSQQQANGAGASSSQIKVRTPLPTEPQTEERRGDGRGNENNCENDGEEDNEAEDDNDANDDSDKEEGNNTDDDADEEEDNDANEDDDDDDANEDDDDDANEDDDDDAEKDNDAEEEASDASPISTHDLPTEQDPADFFTLTPDQLGERMPETLYQLSQKPKFANRARVPWIKQEALGADIEKKLVPKEDCDMKFNIFQARQDGGMNIYRDDPKEGRDFEWPDFSEIGDVPTKRQAVKALVKFLGKPDKTVSYFNGIMESELYDACPLYAGKMLAETEALIHANQTYTHLGKEGSATAMHQEDANFWSVNVCFGGAKLWTVVAEKHTRKFEAWVRDNWICKTCPQFVRHLNMFFGPEQLKAAGIEFEIFVQGPGVMVVTKPYQYHQVFNVDHSLAISINFLAPGQTPTFFDHDGPLEVCNECGLKNLCGREGFHVTLVDSDIPPPSSDDSGDSDAAATIPGQKRKPSQHATNITKRRRADKKDWVDAVPARRSQRAAGQQVATLPNGVGEEVDKRAERLSRMEEYLKQGRFVVTPTLNEGESMADDVVRLALSILSRDALKQLIKAIEYSKRPPKEWARKPLDQLELNDGNPAYKSIARRSKQMNETEEKTDCSKITDRHDQLQFATDCQALRDERNVDRLPSDVVDEICKMSSSTRQQVKDRNKEGTKWRSVCGKLNYGSGLLALIPCCRISLSPFDVSSGDYTALAKEKENGRLRRFHELLDSNYARSICAAAEAWLKAVDEGKQFGLDDIGSDVDWDNLREDEILEQLESLRPIR